MSKTAELKSIEIRDRKERHLRSLATERDLGDDSVYLVSSAQSMKVFMKVFFLGMEIVRVVNHFPAVDWT